MIDKSAVCQLAADRSIIGSPSPFSGQADIQERRHSDPLKRGALDAEPQRQLQRGARFRMIPNREENQKDRDEERGLSFGDLSYNAPGSNRFITPLIYRHSRPESRQG